MILQDGLVDSWQDLEPAKYSIYSVPSKFLSKDMSGIEKEVCLALIY